MSKKKENKIMSENEEKEFEEKIEKQNMEIVRWIWEIFVCVITSIVTALLCTK